MAAMRRLLHFNLVMESAIATASKSYPSDKIDSKRKNGLCMCCSPGEISLIYMNMCKLRKLWVANGWLAYKKYWLSFSLIRSYIFFSLVLLLFGCHFHLVLVSENQYTLTLMQTNFVAIHNELYFACVFFSVLQTKILLLQQFINSFACVCVFAKYNNLHFSIEAGGFKSKMDQFSFMLPSIYTYSHQYGWVDWQKYVCVCLRAYV